MILHIPWLTVVAQTLFALLLGMYIGKVLL